LDATRDFWITCGHHLLDRDAAGQLIVTGEFLKAYLARPELVPPPDACPEERRLHDALLEDPWHPVTPSRIAAIADSDARENWGVMIRWRDHLVESGTLEAAYLALVRRSLRLPRLFIDQLVQVILRNMLDGCDDAFVLRAAEMFFRPQRLTLQKGGVLAIDQEAAANAAQLPVSPLASLLGLPPASGVDVLDDANARSYWTRSDMFDLSLDLTFGQRGLEALGDVIARWISHLLAVDVEVEPLSELREQPLTWYVGLDADATRIGDALWNGGEIDDDMRARVLSLYRLRFLDAADVIERVRGEPVYLVLAMTPEQGLVLKPQNLVTGLPVVQAEVVH